MNIIPIRRIEFTIGANTEQPIAGAIGDALFVVSCSANSGVTAKLSAGISGTQVADGIPIRKGASYKKLPAIFDKCTFKNENAVSVTGEIWVGEGDLALNVQAEALQVGRPRFLAPVNGGTGTDFTIAPSDTDTYTDDLFVTADTIYIQNDEESAGPLRVSMGVSAGDDVGLKVQPGETLPLPFSSASSLRIYSPSSNADDCIYRIWYLTDTPTA